MERTARYITIYTTARIVIRFFVYSSGLSVAVKGAKWVNRVAKAHRLIDKSPESITENLFESLSEID